MQNKENNSGTMTIMIRCCIPIIMKIKIIGSPKNLIKRNIKPTKEMSDNHQRYAIIHQARRCKNFPYKLKNPSCLAQKQISTKEIAILIL